jgi:hypothetical protein
MRLLRPTRGTLWRHRLPRLLLLLSVLLPAEPRFAGTSSLLLAVIRGTVAILRTRTFLLLLRFQLTQLLRTMTTMTLRTIPLIIELAEHAASVKPDSCSLI